MGGVRVFSIFFLGWREALQGKVSLDGLTIAIEHEGEVIPLGTCAAKDAVRDVIGAITFAVKSCEGVRELHLRAGEVDVLLFPGKYCQESLVLNFGTYDPISYVRIKKGREGIRLEVYREDKKVCERS